MVPVRRNQNWMSNIFNDIFDDNFMVRTSTTAPAINVVEKDRSYELELAEKKLAEAQSNLENAEENLRLADESFHAGVVSSSDLMAAQTAWMQAKSEVVDAEIEIEMSKVYLRQALGEGIEK